MLMADVAGSTSIAERLGPERAKFLFDEVQRLMAAEVRALDGTVAQLMGDGMLALFGAPLAHEDDPERAGARGPRHPRRRGHLRARRARGLRGRARAAAGRQHRPGGRLGRRPGRPPALQRPRRHGQRRRPAAGPGRPRPDRRRRGHGPADGCLPGRRAARRAVPQGPQRPGAGLLPARRGRPDAARRGAPGRPRLRARGARAGDGRRGRGPRRHRRAHRRARDRQDPPGQARVRGVRRPHPLPRGPRRRLRVVDPVRGDRRGPATLARRLGPRARGPDAARAAGPARSALRGRRLRPPVPAAGHDHGPHARARHRRPASQREPRGPPGAHLRGRLRAPAEARRGPAGVPGARGPALGRQRHPRAGRTAARHHRGVLGRPAPPVPRRARAPVVAPRRDRPPALPAPLQGDRAAAARAEGQPRAGPRPGRRRAPRRGRQAARRALRRQPVLPRGGPARPAGERRAAARGRPLGPGRRRRLDPGPGAQRPAGPARPARAGHPRGRPARRRHRPLVRPRPAPSARCRAGR